MRVTRFLVFTCVFLIAALVGTDAYAGGRPDSSSRNWFGHINGGYAFASGTTSDFLDDDWTFGGGVGPGTFIVGKQSSDEFGWNIGLGYSFPNTEGRGYVELRYERLEFENESIEYIPLTVGFRW